jgi:hypothetical protein
MGHDFPPSAIDRIGDLIAETVARANSVAQPAMA